LSTRRPAAFLALGTLAFLASLGAVAPARGAELSGSVQQAIRTATFEVVQLKPSDGGVTYDREPPWDLVPYQERTDKYRSIGTAFAIGPNRYVTAGHVIELGMGSQYGPPALRDGAGKVYDIDQVLKFSDGRDFVVFSLRAPPKGGKFLATGAKPAVNTPVFAVGNALGQGVIIRDGLYTSDTPEELDGRWQWLRFSAAASPGNSGGPLVDERGRVIGVVLRKSPAENLNVALPIGEVNNAKEAEGDLGGRLPVRLPLFDASEKLTVDERFDLPKPLAQFYSTVSDLMLPRLAHAQQALLEHNADHVFPRGEGSARLLHTIDRAQFPRLMHEDANKVWVEGAPKVDTVQLDRNGFVEQAGAFVRLRAPDGVGLATLYGDDKLYLDLLLRAYMVRRTVGSDSVRVTSLGKPQSAGHFTDRWGRTWQVRDWAIPYDDQTLIVTSLPVPDGYVATVNRIRTGYVGLMHKTQQLLCDYVYVTMLGTLAQWQDYLAQAGVQPKAFETLVIRIDPERQVVFHSDRFELTVNSDLVKLTKDSMLFLDFGFSGSADAVAWGVNRVVVGERLHTNNWVSVFREMEPPTSLPDNFQSNWNKLKTRSFPFNGMIESKDGDTRVSATAEPPGQGSRVRYGLVAAREGVQSQDTMSRELELLEHSFRALPEEAR
jgi:serine protease Do